jgi:glycosyltransferase involved in cell wall biosynthesis
LYIIQAKKEAILDIDVIIPVYNGEKHIRYCLDSIIKQDYKAGRVNIYIVDDDSSDNTVAIAKEYNCTILKNGARHIERGKSIGIMNSSSELILLMDIDNYFPETGWIRTAVERMEAHPAAVAVEACWFNYRRSDPAANRYCALFGINDPIAFYMGRRDKLMATEKDWRIYGSAKDIGDHFVVEFSPDRVSTLGSQGFLIRRKYLQYTETDPYFFHIEGNAEIISKGFNKYIFLKNSTGHNHVSSTREFLKKCRRNIYLFYKHRHLRKYKWESNPVHFFFLILSMVTVVRPLYDAAVNFFKKPDPAWFLHPYFCFMVPVIYAIETVKVKLGIEKF